MSEKSYVLVNGNRVDVEKSDYALSLLEWLRSRANMLSVRSGCGTQKHCGICIVQVAEKATLSCNVQMLDILTKNISTVEGIPEEIRMLLADILLREATVPCGYCTAGLLVKIHTILQENTIHTKAEIITLLGFSSCTCMGAKQIVDVVIQAEKALRTQIDMPHLSYGGVPCNAPRFGENRVVFGEKPFIEDLFLQEKVLYATILWNAHALNTIEKIDIGKARTMKGVHAIITAKDVAHSWVTMFDTQEWQIFLSEGSTAYCESEIIAVIVANSREEALLASSAIEVVSTVHTPHTNSVKIVQEGLHSEASFIHHTLHYGEPIENLLKEGICTVSEVLYTKPKPYIPLEKPSVLAMRKENDIYIYTQVADMMWLRSALASILDIPEESIHCIRSEANSLFSAREDYFLALCAGIASYRTDASVRMEMSHDEVARYRSQPLEMIHDYALFLDSQGYLVGAKIALLVDGGAYTTDINYVCTTLMKHLASGYAIQNVDISLVFTSTNTVPKTLVRGKSLEASTIVMNRLVDKLSKITRFNRYEIRNKNILKKGMFTLTGEYLFGAIETEAMLERAKTYYDSHPSVSMSISALDSGLSSTNAMCMVAIDVLQGNDLVIYQPYPDFGNGLSTLIAQTVVGILGKNSYSGMTIRSTTDCMATMQTIPQDEGVMLYLVHKATQEATAKLALTSKKTKHFSALWGQRFIGFSSISSEMVRDTTKTLVRQGSYSFITCIARCETPATFIGVVVLVDAGTPFNEQFCKTLLEGGICVGYNALVATQEYVKQPINTSIECIIPKETIGGYSFKSIYDISVIAMGSGLYSSLWINNKENICSYPV